MRCSGVPDDLGVGVADDDVSLALVARRGRLPELAASLASTTRCPSLALQLVDAVDRADPAAPCPRRYAVPAAYRRSGGSNVPRMTSSAQAA